VGFPGNRGAPDSPDGAQMSPIWAIRAFIAADYPLIAQVGPIWALRVTDDDIPQPHPISTQDPT